LWQAQKLMDLLERSQPYDIQVYKQCATLFQIGELWFLLYFNNTIDFILKAKGV
jgi:hypothetical protein